MIRIAPVPPSGWPRAIAPPLGLVLRQVGADLLRPGEHDRGERLVDLEHVDVVDRQCRCARAAAAVASIGPVSISTGSTPTRHVSTTRALGVRPSAFGLRLRHHQHRRGAVGDLRRVAGGVHAVLAGDRLQRGQLLERRLAEALVARRRRASSRRRACRPRRGRRRRPATHWPSKRPSAHAAAARCCDDRPKRVGVVAGDAPLVGDALGALELRRHLVPLEVRLGDRHAEAELLRRVRRRSGPGSSPRRRTRSRRRPRRTPTSAAARLVACWLDPHCVSTVVAAVDSGSPAASQARAGDVEALLADLADAAADDLADLPRGRCRCARRRPVCTMPSRSAGCTLARPPLRRRSGVRTASTITTLDMVGAYARCLSVDYRKRPAWSPSWRLGRARADGRPDPGAKVLVRHRCRPLAGGILGDENRVGRSPSSGSQWCREPVGQTGAGVCWAPWIVASSTCVRFSTCCRPLGGASGDGQEGGGGGCDRGSVRGVGRAQGNGDGVCATTWRRVPTATGGREFRTWTSSTAWSCGSGWPAEGVTQVAMEATGVYWRPVWHVLEISTMSSCCWSTPQHVKNLPGRKTDVNGRGWLAQLLECGLLRGSFVPPPVIAQLAGPDPLSHQTGAGPGAGGPAGAEGVGGRRDQAGLGGVRRDGQSGPPDDRRADGR